MKEIIKQFLKRTQNVEERERDIKMTLRLSLQHPLGIKVQKLGKVMLVIQKKGPVTLPTNAQNTANSGTRPLEWEKLLLLL